MQINHFRSSGDRRLCPQFMADLCINHVNKYIFFFAWARIRNYLNIFCAVFRGVVFRPFFKHFLPLLRPILSKKTRKTRPLNLSLHPNYFGSNPTVNPSSGLGFWSGSGTRTRTRGFEIFGRVKTRTRANFQTRSIPRGN